MGIVTLYTPTKTKGGKPLCEGLAWYQTEEGCVGVDLAYQKTGYGQRAFLICPICGARREKLYISNWRVGCRLHVSHGGVYRGIQRTTKGGADRIVYTMRKMSEKAFVPFALDRDYYLAICDDDRPRYMNKFKFADLMARLYVLNELRCRVLFETYLSRHGGRGRLEENVELIRFIERGKPEELRGTGLYDSIMSFAQWRYGKDWGFPEEL